MIDVFKKNLRVSAFSKLSRERLISFISSLNFILGVYSYFLKILFLQIPFLLSYTLLCDSSVVS